MRIHRQQNRGHGHLLLKILLAIVLIVGVSLSLAWVWQTTEQAAVAEASSQAEQETPLPPTQPDPAETTQKKNASMVETPPPDHPADASGADSTPPVAFKNKGLVPESSPVDSSYFTDALFLGDSITTGIPLYHIADEAAVVAMTGINTHNINHKLCIPVEGSSEERVTILEAAKSHGSRSKVYIMLGGNGLGFEKDVFISGYKTFLDSVKAQYPDATIYLQSITPVVDGYVNEFDPTMDNDKIDAYNQEILKLAEQENVYYLDIASALKDENGALPKEASPVDGLHFSPEYYAKWFDYLKTHTVEGARQS